MSDEIDIEEHDILDNPVIKNIFPDLSVLKKEILDYDEVPDLVTDITLETTSVDVKKTSDNPNVNESEKVTNNRLNNIQINTRHDFKIAEDLKQEQDNKLPVSKKLKQLEKHTNKVCSESHMSKNMLSTVNCSINFQKESKPLQNLTYFKSNQSHSNKIILGSKPSIINKQKDHLKNFGKNLTNVCVLVTDCASSLHNSDRYCSDCLTLFSTYIELEAHKKTDHHNFSKIQNKIKKEVTKSVKDHICLICNISFSTKNTLNRHQTDFHNLKNNVTISNSSTVISRKYSKPNNYSSRIPLSDIKYGCFHCSKSFLDQKSLIEHLYNVLQMKNSKTHSEEKLQENISNDMEILEKHTDENYKEQDSVINNNKCTKIKFAVSNKKQEMDVNLRQKYVKYKNNEKLNKVNISVKVNNPLISSKLVSLTIQDKNDEVLVNNSDCNKKLDTSSTDIHDCKKRKLPILGKKCKVNCKKPKLTLPDKKCKKVITKHIQKTSLSYNMHQVKKASEITNRTKLFYECKFCSHYFNKLKYYKLHLQNKHKVKNILKTDKVAYSPKCKYCPKISKEMILYNVHLRKYHKEKIHVVIKDIEINSKVEKKSERTQQNSSIISKCTTEEKCSSSNSNISILELLILKSVLYKCSKCDIHFLCLETALSHVDHMEISINWKCTICLKIFKKSDEALHKKQHLHVNTFSVYNTSDIDVALILYKCTKCTIHYDEKHFRRHYSDCELKSPNASYCIVCDILIDNNIMKSHEYDHKHKNYDLNNFTIIECDLLCEEANGAFKEYESNKKINIKLSKKSRIMTHITDRMLLVKSFCNTCKCFVSDVGWLREVHLQSRCQHLTKRICIYCGLLLTSKTLATHKNMHRRNPKITLQDFRFYELNSRKLIKPPIPEYPKCEICDIHFMSKLAIKNHLCSENEFLTCTVCSIKLSKSIFKLHMAFHNYLLNNKSKFLNHKSAKLPVSERIDSNTNLPNINNNLPQPCKLEKFIALYRCKRCSTTFIMYDKVIDHCHLHYNNREHEIKTVRCNDCELSFEIGCYESHKILHDRKNTSYKRPLEFDIFYFQFDNDIWTKHIFGPLSQNQVKKILRQSIYRFEHRLIMNIVQEGSSDITLYKCNKCSCIIEPELIFKHIQINCLDVRKYCCIFCGLSFISLVFKRNHEKIHSHPSIILKSFRVVLFNQTQHRTYNSTFNVSYQYYILYQCRICNITIQKFQRSNHKCNKNELMSCTECGLLFDQNEYESHITKHKDVDSFISENIKVILFGEVSEDVKKNYSKKLLSFRGAVYDYTFYKCSSCDICLRNIKSTLLHICAPTNYKIKCSKCGLHFHCNWYKAHNQSHIVDPGFEIENMNIISFDAKISVSINPKNNNLSNSDSPLKQLTLNCTESTRDTIVHIEKSNQIVTTGKETEEFEARINDVGTHSSVKFFKCTECGLNFLDEPSIKIHFNHCGPKSKLSKQNCTKCNLLFTPNILFTHLLTHHGQKNNVFKYEIIEVTKTMK
ncbi:zinc finger protein 91-like isoform X1 [Galleria mellonella]|uniref:Zinc finger protein 91-like isoform X1 n=1 Tax=Galleria mellonella TaxID=7137 RepID=A0A6J3C8A0_GALME|nr:zinc finger protein 91-like isoform X1 [Galleria mellonella]XP_031769688.2 zinc finger protein 91-like isoform X1 [Galleria mellonella]